LAVVKNLDSAKITSCIRIYIYIYVYVYVYIYVYIVNIDRQMNINR